MALWGKQDAATPTGTSIDVTNGSAAVTGTGTTFLTDIDAGDTLIIGTVKYKVLSITSNTALTLTSNFEGSNATLTISSEPVRVQQSPKNLSLTDKRKTFGVDSTEAQAGGDNVVDVNISFAGTRYLEVPAVTFSGGGGSSAAATTTIAGGVVTAIAVTNVGSAYTSAPTVAIAKPRRTISVAAGGSDTIAQSTDTIPYTAHGLVANEEVKYNNGGGASATGLVSTTSYFVANAGLTANAFEVKAAATSGTLVATVATSGTAGQFTCGASTLAVGDRVKITGTNTGTGTITGYATGNTYKVSAVTGTSPSVTGFTLTTEAAGALVTTAGTLVGLTYTTETVIDISGAGTNAQFFEIQATADQATAVADLGSGEPGAIASPGWVLRTEGTGGRAGRIQYETLVAGRSLITGDAADDVEFPDS